MKELYLHPWSPVRSSDYQLIENTIAENKSITKLTFLMGYGADWYPREVSGLTMNTSIQCVELVSSNRGNLGGEFPLDKRQLFLAQKLSAHLFVISHICKRASREHGQSEAHPYLQYVIHFAVIS